MDFAILGPLRVVGPEGPIELTAAKQRALLATLLLAHREQAVSPDAPDRRAVGRGPAGHGRQGAPGPRLAAAARARARRPDRHPRVRLRGRARDRASSTSSASRRSSRRRARSARPAGCRRPRGCCGRRSSCSAERRSSTRRCSGPAALEPGRLAAMRLAVLEERIDVDVEIGGHALLVDELETLATEHPVPRAAARAADARALPRRPPGRRARGLPPRPPLARRGPRPRAGARAAAPRGRDPRPGLRARRAGRARGRARGRRPRCRSR